MAFMKCMLRKICCSWDMKRLAIFRTKPVLDQTVSSVVKTKVASGRLDVSFKVVQFNHL